MTLSQSARATFCSYKRLYRRACYAFQCSALNSLCLHVFLLFHFPLFPSENVDPLEEEEKQRPRKNKSLTPTKKVDGEKEGEKEKASEKEKEEREEGLREEK